MTGQRATPAARCAAARGTTTMSVSAAPTGITYPDYRDDFVGFRVVSPGFGS